ncbi:MAG: fibronectin type III domain-containing protein, partial [Armatimonadetes bacterium]|nr:fibronectin type III domain-containing protein [Armatimonadota bacterium]
MIASVQHLVQHLQPMTAPRRVSLPVLILLLLSMFGGMLHAASVELEVVSVSATTVDLSWSATDLTGLQVYEVTWIVPGISKIKPVQQLTSTTITGLTASTRYSFRVAAKCGATTVYSQYAYATTSGPGSSNTPSAPANLQATEVSFNVVELGWVDTSANASGFKIYRSSNPSSGFVQVGTTNKGITSYRNAGLSASTTYYFKVCANNADGDSDFTDVLAVTTSATPPAAPTKLTASAVSTDQINLSWSDASQNEDGFTIERSTSNNGPFDKVATVEANAASYADSNLNDATSYFYRVYAFNAEGSSGYSNVANATTKARPPETPTGLQATATSTSQIALSWTGVSGAMGYKLQYAVGANGCL